MAARAVRKQMSGDAASGRSAGQLPLRATAAVAAQAATGAPSAGEGFLSDVAFFGRRNGAIVLSSSIEVASTQHRNGAVEASLNVQKGLESIQAGLENGASKLQTGMIVAAAIWAVVTYFKNR